MLRRRTAHIANGTDNGSDNRYADGDDEEMARAVVKSSEGGNAIPSKLEMPMARRITMAWDDFFHARTSTFGCKVGAAMRIAFAVIFLYDRVVMTLDFAFFFSGSLGVLPYSHQRGKWFLTIFQLAPNSEALLWLIHLLGLMQGFLLLIGVAPRFQAFCVFLNLACFHHHNDMIYDKQDILCRTWAWLLCFLPLHRLTIYEWFESRKVSKRDREEKYRHDSWPLWPFRLWQLQLCFIYSGASLGKVHFQKWYSGNALYYLIHEDNFFGGLISSLPVFNRILPLKIMTYASLILELTCWIFVWSERTRMPIVVSMLIFHLGLDLAMNIHTFQWLSMTGWLAFLVKRSDTSGKRSTESKQAKRKGFAASRNRHLVNLFLAMFIIIFGIETLPIHHFEKMAPKPFKPAVKWAETIRSKMHRKFTPFLRTTGVWQGVWAMYGNPNIRNSRVIAQIKYENGTKVVWEQPDWDVMPWWRKKLYYRQVLYWDSMMYSPEDNDDMGIFADALCKRLAVLHGPDVTSIELKGHKWSVPEPPADLRWFDKAKQEMKDMGTKRLYKWKNAHSKKHKKHKKKKKV